MKYKWKKEELIQNYPLKEHILERFSKSQYEERVRLKFLFKSYLRRQKQKFESLDWVWKDSISKSTSQRVYSLNIDDKKYLLLNLDIAAVIGTKFTPKILKEFSARTSYNLSQSVLDHLCIVAKSSHEEKFNKNTTEWSYSFCHIENHIFADVFTTTQRLTYLVTKSIFKKHIQPLDNNLLTSYLMKTVLLWRFENETFSQDDWFNDTKILSQTRNLFKDLKRFLEEGFLPMYFIPKLNLTERMDKNLRIDVIDVIEQKVLNSSFDDLFNVEELKKAQELLTNIKSFLYFEEKYYSYEMYLSVFGKT